MLATGGDVLGGAIGAEVDRVEVVAHFVRVIGAPLHIAQAELTSDVQSPALDGVVVEERARVFATGGDVLGGAIGAEVDRVEVVAHFVRLVAAVYTIAQAEPTFLIISPALDGVVVEERARVLVTGGDVLGGAIGAEVDRVEVVAHFVRLVAAASRIAQAELTCKVGSPALDGVVVEERARVTVTGGDVTVTGGDVLGGATGAEVARGEVVAHFVRLVAAV